MFSEASVNAAAANDNCGASRAQKDMPPRFTKHHQNMNASGNSAFLEPEGNRPPVGLDRPRHKALPLKWVDLKWSARADDDDDDGLLVAGSIFPETKK